MGCLNKHISLKIHSDLSDGINTALNCFIVESVLENNELDLKQRDPKKLGSKFKVTFIQYEQ